MESDTDDDIKSVYAGGDSSISSLPSSSDGYLQRAGSCCLCSGSCEEVDCGWVRIDRSLAENLYPRLFGARPKAVVVFNSERIQSRSGWPSSLMRISMLLAACSLSSLAACFALSGFSLSYFETNVWTELLLQPPLADRRSPEQNLLKHSDLAAQYSWDCLAQAGRAKCRPVQKAESLRKGSRLTFHQQYRPSVIVFRVLVEGVYHLSAQVAGTAWQAPPTLLRIVISRVIAKSSTVNVTIVHSITGAGDGSDALASLATQRGSFSVYMAATLRLSTRDELLAQVVCVEDPNCVVHVNGTASHLTLEKLD